MSLFLRQPSLTLCSRQSFSISDWRWINAELERGDKKRREEDNADCGTVSSGVLERT
jgi:hypothetical protein